jgi:hypothetical protein
MILSAKLKPSSVKSYLNSLATLHKLRNIPYENFSCYLVKTLVRGAENLNFYNTEKKINKESYDPTVVKNFRPCPGIM